MTDPALPKPRRRSVWPMTLLISALLLLSFAAQYPTPAVADWSEFSFYDPGTVYKADALLAKGYLPTLDFGYTHGLLPLLYARLGFAILGHGPTTFLILTLLAEMVMAWALARIFAALNLRLFSKILFLLAIPIAIMPAYLTLTHPLEAMFILLALADHAENKLPRALALLTVCLFVKPSMAYVYGFLLVVLIIKNTWPHFSKTLRAFVPAAVTFITVSLGLAAWLGVHAVIYTLIPSTGAKTYAASGFGFFAAEGRAFWLNHDPLYYLMTLNPAGIFLLAVAATVVATIRFAPLFFKMPDGRGKILCTVAILHTAFLVAFYGWTGSWTYYSYLPILGVVILVDLIPPAKLRHWMAIVMCVLIILGQATSVGLTVSCWRNKQRTSEGLYVYDEQLDEYHEMLDAAKIPLGDRPPHLLIMTIGWIQNLPPNTEMIDAWFPETGIPTASEIARVRKQADAADYVLLWNQYAKLDLWNSPEFAEVRAEFETTLTGKRFTLLRRKHPRF